MEGLILVDKPPGPTSHDVVEGVRRILGGVRVGHAGTLDPAASGLLILLAGRATRQAARFSGLDKTYEGRVVLGIATDTADAEGKAVDEKPVPPLDEEAITAALSRFLGETRQTPPAYSAVKVGGRPAYWYARRGKKAPLAERTIRIARLELAAWRPSERAIDFRMDCSSGTYVRSWAEDLARALGTVGHLARLRRTRIGPFRVEEALPWGPRPGRADLLAGLREVPPGDISVEPPSRVDDTERNG